MSPVSDPFMALNQVLIQVLSFSDPSMLLDRVQVQFQIVLQYPNPPARVQGSNKRRPGVGRVGDNKGLWGNFSSVFE